MRQRRPVRRKPSAEAAGEVIEVTVDRLGARGDGVASGPVYVPLTVPGDRVRARVTGRRGDGRVAEIVELLTPGPGRAEPACRHFGICGGCAFQHLAPDLYLQAKRDILTSALSHHGIAPAPLLPFSQGRPGTRRRVRFSLLRLKGRGAVLAGFARRGSHDLCDLAECPVLEPALVALLAPLRELMGVILQPGEGAEATLLLVKNGADLLLDLPRAPDLVVLEALAHFAETQDLARLVWRQGGKGPVWPLALRRKILVKLAGTAVEIPPDSFLQATLEGEAALTQAVVEAVGAAPRAADLFAGFGTFSFALARTASVHAVESLTEAVQALRAGLGQRGTAEMRDLQAEPLDPVELADFDAVVLDPPRSGAAAQMQALAQSLVPLVVSVSCNPASFARDARILLDGGYDLLSILPVDQFLWSPHVELVGVFRR